MTPSRSVRGHRPLDTVRGVSNVEASPETERAGLSGFLHMQREALIDKLQGVSDEDARRASTVSSLSLLSLVQHSAIWERRWFQIIVAGRSFPNEWPEVQTDGLDPTFRLTTEDTVETVVADYREQLVRGTGSVPALRRTSTSTVTAAWAGRGCSPLAGIRLLERGDVDLAHLQHRVHRPLVGVGRVVAAQLVEALGDHLPRHAELVLAPATRTRLTTVGGEQLPVAVDLVLGLDRQVERERLVEVELRAGLRPITGSPATVNSTMKSEPSVAPGTPSGAVTTLVTDELGMCWA